jgi:hypothetical protein
LTRTACCQAGCPPALRQAQEADPAPASHQAPAAAAALTSLLQSPCHQAHARSEHCAAAAAPHDIGSLAGLSSVLATAVTAIAGLHLRQCAGGWLQCCSDAQPRTLPSDGVAAAAVWGPRRPHDASCLCHSLRTLKAVESCHSVLAVYCRLCSQVVGQSCLPAACERMLHALVPDAAAASAIVAAPEARLLLQQLLQHLQAYGTGSGGQHGCIVPLLSADLSTSLQAGPGWR